MGKTPITGIGGVLGDLVSKDPQDSDSEPAPTTREPESRRTRHARTGRPPGKAGAPPQRREKLTVRVDADLVEQYRDWSWDARCNLGELVGQAMRCYLKNRHHKA